MNSEVCESMVLKHEVDKITKFHILKINFKLRKRNSVHILYREIKNVKFCQMVKNIFAGARRAQNFHNVTWEPRLQDIHRHVPVYIECLSDYTRN